MSEATLPGHRQPTEALGYRGARQHGATLEPGCFAAAVEVALLGWSRVGMRLARYDMGLCLRCRARFTVAVWAPTLSISVTPAGRRAPGLTVWLGLYVDHQVLAGSFWGHVVAVADLPLGQAGAAAPALLVRSRVPQLIPFQF